jgi:nucleoside-diphosphate-sugar epimerase
LKDAWNSNLSNNKLLVTASSGPIGSELVDYFCQRGGQVHGMDNNMRADFFRPPGDTRWNQRRLTATYPSFHHHELDIRDRGAVFVDDVFIEIFHAETPTRASRLTATAFSAPNV